MQMDNSLTFDIARIKWPLLLAGIILSVSFSAAGVSFYFYSNLSKDRVLVESSIVRKQSELSEQRMLNRIRDEYVAKFGELEKTAHFAPDLKLRWLESINAVSAKFALSSIRYDIGARTLVERAEQSDSSLGVYKTTIDLRIGMLHEGDLVSVTEYFKHANLGLYQTMGCEIVRLGDSLPTKPHELHVNGRCVLTFYDFKFNDRSGDEYNDVAMAY